MSKWQRFIGIATPVVVLVAGAAVLETRAAVAPAGAVAPPAAGPKAPAAKPPAPGAPQVPEESATIRDDPTIAPDPKQSADNNISFPNDT